jgi:hypothetical protein
MFDYVQTAVEGIWIVAVFIGMLFFIGYGAAALLLPEDWRGYRMVWTPIVGWSLLVLGSFAVNLVIAMQTGIWVILAFAAALNVYVLSRRASPATKPEIGAIPPFVLGAFLVILGLIPHIVQRSFSLLSLNQDEEQYYPAAHYILSFPTMGGPHSLTESFLRPISRYGFAFQYSLADASALSGSTTVHTYFPVSYVLLGLSVPAWYLFFREVFGQGQRAAIAGCFFYTLLGLPLWFAYFGYGPQMGSFVAVPAGTVAFVAVLKWGGARRTVLAAIIVAAGLTSYYLVMGLQYAIVFFAVLALITVQQRSLIPLRRAVAVAVLALLIGLPSNWLVIDRYFVQGQILQTENYLYGGWDINEFQPPTVMLGLDAFQVMHDTEGSGPFASLDGGLSVLATPVSWLVLTLAAFGLLTVARKRPLAVAVVLGTAVYLAYVRYVQNFPYGYMKLMPVAAPLAYGLAIEGASDIRRKVLPLLPRRLLTLARFAAVGGFLTVTVLLAYNTYEALWFDGNGWGQSIPNWVDPSLVEMGKMVEPKAKVFVVGRYEYPVPPDRVKLRQHTLGMRSEAEQRQKWAQRVRVMALTELVHADIYGYYQNSLVFSHPNRLLDDESYDYYLLGSGNDPRLDGLDAQDIIWSDPGLALYSSRDVVRKTPWTIMKERGTLAITNAKPLNVGVWNNEIQTDGSLESTPPSDAKRRLRIGILAFTRTEATVQTDGSVRKLTLEPGITWYTTPTIPASSQVIVTPTGESSLGVVSLRLLGAGSEEKDLVPASEVGDSIYASSTVLRLDYWLTDPFQGKKPGTE